MMVQGPFGDYDATVKRISCWAPTEGNGYVLRVRSRVSSVNGVAVDRPFIGIMTVTVDRPRMFRTTAFGHFEELGGGMLIRRTA